MQKPLEIRFHQMEPSTAIEARIREKAAELERFSDRGGPLPRNSVVEGGFESLEPGSRVRLEVAERESGEGWQATTVRLIGKHRLQDEPV